MGKKAVLPSGIVVKIKMIIGRYGATFIVAAIAVKGLQVSVSSYRAELEIGLEPYKLADWLINYQAGFVRRGFIGELTYRLSSDAATQTSYIFTLQVMAYVVIFTSAIILFDKSPRTWPWIALTLSPAFLLFPYVEIAGSFRKETLALAAIGLLALAAKFPRHIALSIFGIAFFILGLLGSEINGLFLPLVLWLLWQSQRDKEHARRIFALTATFTSFSTLVIGGMSFVRPGNSAVANVICGSITSRGFDEGNCSGSINALGSRVSDEIHGVAAQYPAYFGYSLIVLVAMLPLLMTGFTKQHWRLAVVLFITIAPLFVVALDYGRWIMMFIVGLSFAALSISERIPPTRFCLPWPIYVLFIVTWSPTHYGPPWHQESLIGRLLDFGPLSG